MNTYEVRIDVNGYVVTTYFTVAKISDLQFNAEIFYGANAFVKSARVLNVEVA